MKPLLAAGLALWAGLAPAQDLPQGWVHLSDLAPEIAQDIRYARDFNFTGQRVPGYGRETCVLTRKTAQALIRVEARLAAQGYGLVVWDCYRPVRAVAHFARWAETPPPDPDRAGGVFHPGLARPDLFAHRYIARRSGHSVGHTVDVGLRRAGVEPARPRWDQASPCTAPFDSRTPETGLDMGTAFDCFSPLSAIDAPVSDAARRNRALLAQAMQAEGFRGYAREWWHFRNTRDPARAPQDFPLR